MLMVPNNHMTTDKMYLYIYSDECVREPCLRSLSLSSHQMNFKLSFSYKALAPTL